MHVIKLTKLCNMSYSVCIGDQSQKRSSCPITQHEYEENAQQQQGKGGSNTETLEPEAKTSTDIKTKRQEHREQAKGGSNHRNTESMRIRQVKTTSRLHMEHQLKKFCQIHALNALLGQTMVQPRDILGFCKEHSTKSTALGTALQGEGSWCPNQGNFGDMVIDAFLHYHSKPVVRIYSIADRIPIGSNQNRFINGLPAGHDAFILRWNQGNEPHECDSYGHAVCVRRHPVSRKWYLLDSEIGQPILMTDGTWKTLKGSVCILARGSAYAHNSIWGARNEGYTQVVDTLEFLTPDQVNITREANETARLAQKADEQRQKEAIKHELSYAQAHQI